MLSKSIKSGKKRITEIKGLERITNFWNKRTHLLCKLSLSLINDNEIIALNFL